LDYLYNIKKIDEIEVGDIIFTESDENNRPLYINIVLKYNPAEHSYSKPTYTLFGMDDKEIRTSSFDGVQFVYI